MKRTGRSIVALLLPVMFLICFCVGCTPQQEDAAVQQDEKPDGLQVGMSFDSFVIERWLRDRDFFELTAKNLGAEVNVQVANGDPDEQISQIRYLIKRHTDVIVVIAIDGEKLQDVIVEAKRAGIRVICYDRLVTGAAADLYISFDNEQVGRLMGEAMAEALPDGGNIFAIYGSPSDQNVAMVQQGFFSAIEDSGIEIVYENYCENWLAELAFDAVEEGLAMTQRNLAGVMCGNDDLASQAFRALAENRLAGRVVLVGQDADLSACQRIVEGTQTMTVYKPVEQLAQKAAEFACALGYQKMLEEDRIEEKDIPEIALERAEELKQLDRISDTGNIGQNIRAKAEGKNQAYITEKENGDVMITEGNVPYYSIDPIAVTKENMDEVIIGSDFHTAEDVYLNVGSKK